jgi:hypothetical protein
MSSLDFLSLFLDKQYIVISTTITAATTPIRIYPTNLTVETLFFPDAGTGLLPPGLLEECAGSFEGTCPVDGAGNGVGAAGGCADGAMLVLNGFPSFLCNKFKSYEHHASHKREEKYG